MVVKMCLLRPINLVWGELLICWNVKVLGTIFSCFRDKFLTCHPDPSPLVQVLHCYQHADIFCFREVSNALYNIWRLDILRHSNVLYLIVCLRRKSRCIFHPQRNIHLISGWSFPFWQHASKNNATQPCMTYDREYWNPSERRVHCLRSHHWLSQAVSKRLTARLTAELTALAYARTVILSAQEFTYHVDAYILHTTPKAFLCRRENGHPTQSAYQLLDSWFAFLADSLSGFVASQKWNET